MPSLVPSTCHAHTCRAPLPQNKTQRSSQFELCFSPASQNSPKTSWISLPSLEVGTPAHLRTYPPGSPEALPPCRCCFLCLASPAPLTHVVGTERAIMLRYKCGPLGQVRGTFTVWVGLSIFYCTHLPVTTHLLKTQILTAIRYSFQITCRFLTHFGLLINKVLMNNLLTG